MTIEDRYVADVVDISAVRFECGCGTGLSIPVDKFDKLPALCPGCGKQWIIGNDPADQAIQYLMKSLRDVANIKTMHVRFELPRPKP